MTRYNLTNRLSLEFSSALEKSISSSFAFFFNSLYRFRLKNFPNFFQSVINHAFSAGNEDFTEFDAISEEIKCYHNFLYNNNKNNNILRRFQCEINHPGRRRLHSGGHILRNKMAFISWFRTSEDKVWLHNEGIRNADYISFSECNGCWQFKEGKQSDVVDGTAKEVFCNLLQALRSFILILYTFPVIFSAKGDRFWQENRPYKNLQLSKFWLKIILITYRLASFNYLHN